MGNTKIDSADTTNFSAKDYADSAAAQDTTLYPSSYSVTSAGDTTQSSYQNTNFLIEMGAYNEISELAGMIDRKAMFVVGRGIKTSIFKNRNLKFIKGNGLDTFNSIMYNNVRTYTIGGDSFNEIIKNKRGQLRNLKPLNPSSVKIIKNKFGTVSGYDVFSHIDDFGKKVWEHFEPNEIFHLAYNRLADQIHGQSVVKKLMPVIEMRGEAMRDMRVVFHRYVKPLWVISVDTDDTAEITAFKKKLDTTLEKSENMVVPKDTVDKMESFSIPQYSTLDPLPWLRLLQEEFLKAEGIPALVMGGGGQETTESESKILYLAWQQVVEFNQLFLEEQIQQQLGIKVEFEFPASIAPELQGDEKKDPKENTRARADR